METLVGTLKQLLQLLEREGLQELSQCFRWGWGQGQVLEAMGGFWEGFGGGWCSGVGGKESEWR